MLLPYKLPAISRADLQRYRDIINDYESTTDQYDHAALVRAVDGDSGLVPDWLRAWAHGITTGTVDAGALMSLAERGHPDAILWAAKMHASGIHRIPALDGEPIFEVACEAIIALGRITWSESELLDQALNNNKLAIEPCDRAFSLPVATPVFEGLSVGSSVVNPYRIGKRAFQNLCQQLSDVVNDALAKILTSLAPLPVTKQVGAYAVQVFSKHVEADPGTSGLPALRLTVPEMMQLHDDISRCLDPLGAPLYTLKDTALLGIRQRP